MKLSVYIATKNRQKYLIETLKSFECVSKDCQIIVSDNSESPLNDAVLRSLEAKINLKYFFVKDKIPSVENFRRHMGECTGEYVSCIGDDDTVHPNIIEILNYLKKFNAPVIVGNLNYSYSWPGALSGFAPSSLNKGILKGKKSTMHVETVSNDTAKLVTLAESGGFQYLSYQLPKLYHGFVRKDVLYKIKDFTGNFVGGVSPDIYWATALTILSDWHLRVDFPMTLPGTCYESSSVQEGKLKVSADSFRVAPHLINFDGYKRDMKIPDIYCMETVWAASFLDALIDLNADDIYRCFNTEKLLKAIKKKRYHMQNKDTFIEVIKSSAYRALRQMKFRVLYVNFILSKTVTTQLSGSTYFFNVDSISKAQQILLQSSGEFQEWNV